MENGKEEKGKDIAAVICGIGLIGGIAAMVIGIPTWYAIEKSDYDTKANYLGEICDTLNHVDESQIPDLNLYNIEIGDVPGARFRLDRDKKFIDIIATEYGTGYQYRFSFQISDDYYNLNREKIDQLSSSVLYFSKDEKKDAMKSKADTFKMLKDLVSSQKFTELAVAEAEGEKFEVLATGLDKYDLTKNQTTQLSENSDLNISYDPSESGLDGYQM